MNAINQISRVRRGRVQGRMTYTTVEKLWGYLLIAPFMVFFTIFVLVPYGMVIWLSFVDWHPRGVTAYVGLQNYMAVISTDVARKAMFNSFYFALLVVPISTALSLITAMLIVSLRNRGLRSFFQATFYLPGVISGLSVAIIWRFVFDYHVGILNFFLSLLGVEAVNWLGNIYTALPSLAGMAILSGNGVAIIIFCAALLSVPADLYHAAAVDGANFWRQQWSITLPLITPALLYVIVVSTLGALQVFVPVYVLTRGGPVYSTMTVGYYIYNQLIFYGNTGTAAAAGLLLLIVTIGLTIFQFRRFSQVVEF
ncbi:MAG TPA: sugar ABC transporter permease [Caldilineaceae bacterium]|nr:sugar ABC transporter permease [Caldilineaceae bacterium]